MTWSSARCVVCCILLHFVVCVCVCVCVCVLCWKTAEEAPMTKELRTILEALVTKQKSFEFSDFVPEVISKNGAFCAICI